MGKKLSKVLLLILGIILAALFLFPVYILLINSFKPLKEIYTDILAFPVKDIATVQNYIDAFKRLDFVKSFLNSIIVTGCGTLGTMLFSSMAAWVLARNKNKISNIIFMVYAISMIIPFQCVMLPLISEMGNLHMLNRAGLIFMNIGFACGFAIMLFHGFINNVPIELEQAAAIDGCTQWKIFFRIVMPLMKSIYATVAVLNVMALWNDFLLPSLTINKDGMQTLPLKTYLFFGQFAKRWDLGTAGLMMVMLPIIVFYIFCQKYIIKGVTEGAVKG